MVTGSITITFRSHDKQNHVFNILGALKFAGMLPKSLVVEAGRWSPDEHYITLQQPPRRRKSG